MTCRIAVLTFLAVAVAFCSSFRPDKACIILHLQRLSRLRTAKWDHTRRLRACAESREVWTRARHLRRRRNHATRLSGAPYGLWPRPCRDLRVGKGIQEIHNRHCRGREAKG